jgi:hypothetical protein
LYFTYTSIAEFASEVTELLLLEMYLIRMAMAKGEKNLAFFKGLML